MGNNCSYNCCTKEEPSIRKAQELEVDNFLHTGPLEAKMVTTKPQEKTADSNQIKQIYPSTDQNNQNEEVENLDMNFFKENESKIVKMQANARGHLTRKHMKDDDKGGDTKKVSENSISKDAYVPVNQVENIPVDKNEAKNNSQSHTNKNNKSLNKDVDNNDNEFPKKESSFHEKRHLTQNSQKSEKNGVVEKNSDEPENRNNLSKIHGVPEGSEASKWILSTVNLNEPKELPAVKFENGAVYTGSWRNGYREGYGVQKWIDGSYYEGHWKNDRANGYGKLVHADGDVYEGNWLDDKASGHGTYTHKNSAKYVGEWKNDKQSGHGVETWPDGAKYEGLYADGKKHGEGNLFFSDGSIYKGEFSKNDIEGFGVYVWPDGKKYEGNWLKNKMHGKGKLIWPDGRTYDGEFKEDKKWGQGVFEWGDGRKYIGGWLNGKQHGVATYHSANGDVKKGEWVEGKRIGWIEDGKKA